MSGIALPPIPGAVKVSTSRMSTPECNSRPSSAGSTNTVFTNVPHVYFNNYTHNSSSRSFAKTPRRLPSLNNPRRNCRSQLETVSARYSAKYRRTPGIACRLSANSPFLPRSSSVDCLKCLLRVPHRKCESHKYIRVGGGYRHGYWYVKCLLEELEMQRRKEALRLQRLEVIKEKTVKAIKTYVRTKSGRLIEKIIFISEEDYEAFIQGKGAADILKKYLTKEEAEGLESWDKEEVKAVTTFVRTKSGRLIEKLVYVSKKEYDDIKSGKVDAKDVLQKYAEEGETVEGWSEAKMRTIKTHVRTKSGRLIEKVIMISEEDYQAMVKDGKDPAEILKKYISLEEGQTLDSWQSAEPMKAIKTMVRTKSGRLIEKTLYVSADDYERMMQGGGDPKEILKKYMTGDDVGEIESWEKAPDERPMKVVKTFIRTKSGRLIEKQVLLTEDEYREFMESGGNPDLLRKFMDLKKGDVIEDWEKASTVYSLGSDDEQVKNAKPGERVIGKDGAVYEIVVDPLTGKKYKKRIAHPESDVDSGIASMHRGKKGRGGKGGEGITEEETAKERLRRKAGKREEGSDSDYSYKSFQSDGGTRHVKRRRKRADGTYSASESYHSSQDEDGQARRRRRRRERKHGPDSAHSYHSYISEGGTRHVKRRKKRADGTYSASESYHSSDSDLPGGRLATKKKKEKAARKKAKERVHGSDSEHSYYSDVSEGGTRTRKRKKRIRDEHGNVIGYEGSEKYSSPDVSSDERRKARKEERRRLGYASDESSVYDETGKRIPKSMVTYGKGSRKDGAEKTDGRGLSNQDEWGGKKGKKKGGKDGNEADDESDEGSDATNGKKKKKRNYRPGSDPDFLYEYDDQGRVIRKKRIKAKDGDGSGSEYEFEYDDKGRLIKQKRVNVKGGDSGSEYEYEYDEHGNLKGKKKIERSPSAESDGDYFEVDEKGEIKLKKGKKKIDLSKLTRDDLIKLGIDPNLSKHEIARLLKEKFGDAIKIVDKKKKIGTKRIDEYGSNADTDELANDSDLDISTLTGTRRVNVLMKRGGQALQDHIKRLMNQSKLQDDYAKDLDERGDIDFLAHYRLVDKSKLESYARAFGVEDEDLDTILTAEETRTALDGVPSIQEITEKQMEYVLKVLKIDDASQITFRMFAVISALSERVTQMDPLSKRLMEICDLLDIQRKMDLYQSMFYWNVNSDRDKNFIKADSLRIELIAGGLNWKQQEYIMERLQPNTLNEISFLDYICYIPLFLSMHDNIVDNPLDMSNNKYDAFLRRPSGQRRQRDMNPLGNPLSKKSSFQMRQQAQELLEGKIVLQDIQKDKQELVQKYTKLPKILEATPSNSRSSSSLG